MAVFVSFGLYGFMTNNDLNREWQVVVACCYGWEAISEWDRGAWRAAPALLPTNARNIFQAWKCIL